MKNKQKYPYILLVPTVGETITPVETNKTSAELIEQWRNDVKLLGATFKKEEFNQEYHQQYLEQLISEETYQFITSFSDIKIGENIEDKQYVINNLKFRIVKND